MHYTCRQLADKMTGFIWVLAIPHISCVILRPDLSEPQLLYLENGDNNSFLWINQDYAGKIPNLVPDIY